MYASKSHKRKKQREYLARRRARFFATQRCETCGATGDLRLSGKVVGLPKKMRIVFTESKDRLRHKLQYSGIFCPLHARMNKCKLRGWKRSSPKKRKRDLQFYYQINQPKRVQRKKEKLHEKLLTLAKNMGLLNNRVS